MHHLEQSRICIFGGSGFVGRYVVRALAAKGALIRVISRDPQGTLSLKTAGAPGQITLEYGNIHDDVSVANAVEDADIVINLVGILFERGNQRFAAAHAKGAERVAQMAAKEGVTQLIHMSALGVDIASSSRYARSKRDGEQAVLAAFPQATILRPSVIFGVEDDFFNRFAHMAATAPALPLIGGGKSLMQPVYVQDVADAIAKIAENPSHAGKIFELAGTEQISFRAILEWIMQQTGLQRMLVNLPFSLAQIIGQCAALLPTPPITADQVRLLKYDNILTGAHQGFEALGITPKSFRTIVPDYLVRYRSGGYYSRWRKVI